MPKYKVTAIDEEKNLVTFEVLIKNKETGEFKSVHTITDGGMDLTNVDNFKAQLSDYALAYQKAVKDKRKTSKKLQALIGKEKFAKTASERVLEEKEEEQDIVEGA